jgi:hypothetical protein
MPLSKLPRERERGHGEVRKLTIDGASQQRAAV